MSVGLITRQSIRRALSNEISADLVRKNKFLFTCLLPIMFFVI